MPAAPAAGAPPLAFRARAVRARRASSRSTRAVDLGRRGGAAALGAARALAPPLGRAAARSLRAADWAVSPQTRDELDAANIEKDRLVEEREEKLSELEGEFDRKRAEMEADFNAQIADLTAGHEVMQQRQNDEIERMRRAMTGDACGWVENKKKPGTYKNSETGETADEKPQLLIFAEVPAEGRASRRVGALARTIVTPVRRDVP